ncbi:MAG TPA: archaellin/type IV pilin N-terminal domain-containing protein [Thermoplasmata archaeon]|nr:archaellin/type IV pilin N-terminal domain-containing protein [Thermoplasmata archaeon]
MNVFGKNERSWRKARKRGVSPIIATILLVAITVVLAAVLYVLISGLTHGTGSAPLGTNFSWGTPFNITGSTTTGCTSATASYCYSIEIAGAGGGVGTSNFQLALRNTLGATIPWVTASDAVKLISPSVGTGPVASYNTNTSAWTNLGTFAGTIGGGFTIVIQVAPTHASGLFGFQLVAIGVNGYSGTVPSNSFQ